MEEKITCKAESMETVDDIIVEGYDDCGSSSAAYECKDDCIIFGGPLFSKIH